jgi:hypothetical protein
MKRKARIGNPAMALATACRCEDTNLSTRQFTRRYARSTLCYSKKVENLRLAVALFIAHLNYCLVHSAHKQMPAQAALLSKDAWTGGRLIEECCSY